MFGIRRLTILDIGQAIELSNAEKWNQTENDWELLICNPNNVCLGIETHGKIIATAAAINYGDILAWIGMVLVDHEYRGRGLSKLLLSNLLQQLKYNRSIKLDATPAGQQVYRKLGFNEEYMIYRMVADPVSMKSIPEENESLPEPVYYNNIPEVVEYDRYVFGVNRKQLIEFLIKNFPKAWMIKEGERITGIATGRKGARFFHVGPVMASCTKDAKELILKFLTKLKGHAVMVDVLNDKGELIEWLYTLGFVKQRHYVRMYKGENFYQGVSQEYYLICGPEFG